MKVTKIICDKCGRELEKERPTFDKDLCEHCEAEFKAVFDAWLKKGTVATQATQEGTQNSADDKVKADKIKAARKAYDEAKAMKEEKDNLVAESCAKVLAELSNDGPTTKGRTNPERRGGAYIDWDRACELKKNGKDGRKLTNREIAEEVGTTPGTIDAQIYKELARRKEWEN